MTNYGYTLLCEQASPRQLVADAERAEAAGFDFAAVSDHYYPWLEEQGHSPYAWSVLGAVAYATERMSLMSFVTCPIRRYHPAVVAQKAATMGALFGRAVHPRGRRWREPQRTGGRAVASGGPPPQDAG